jgi:hypothetical protein
MARADTATWVCGVLRWKRKARETAIREREQGGVQQIHSNETTAAHQHHGHLLDSHGLMQTFVTGVSVSIVDVHVVPANNYSSCACLAFVVWSPTAWQKQRQSDVVFFLRSYILDRTMCITNCGPHSIIELNLLLSGN